MNIREYDKEKILKKLDCLNYDQCQVVKMLYGIENDPMTYEEVADYMNVNEERICQIERKAIRKMFYSQKTRKFNGFYSLDENNE